MLKTKLTQVLCQCVDLNHKMHNTDRIHLDNHLFPRLIQVENSQT
jgi:hypothetical protein